MEDAAPHQWLLLQQEKIIRLALVMIRLAPRKDPLIGDVGHAWRLHRSGKHRSGEW